jgi:hypothetical protein
MRRFTLTEVIKTRPAAQNTDPGGAALRCSPERQVLGRAAIIEVSWPDTP